MHYNLKKTKDSDAETLEHLMTCLKLTFDDADEFLRQDNDKKVIEKWKQAKKYLKRYIKELFLQNYDKTK